MTGTAIALFSSMRRSTLILVTATGWMVFFFALLVAAGAESEARTRPEVSPRVKHARELMGKNYERSVVGKTEELSDVLPFIAEVLSESLPKKWKASSDKIAETLISESEGQELDPVFVLSMIHQESSFNPKARGPFGEIGLMQLKPKTAKWLAKQHDMKWKGERTLEDPITNIRLGVRYLKWLREQLNNHSRLYVNAYNMGKIGVKRAVAKNLFPKDYSNRIMKHYLAYYKKLQSDEMINQLALASLKLTMTVLPTTPAELQTAKQGTN